MLHRVAAVHLLQHPVGAALHRQMDAMTDLFALCHGLEQPGAGILGMAGHKTDAEVAGNGVAQFQQTGKIGEILLIQAVGIDILAQQGDILVALGHQFFQFGNDHVGMTAALSAAHVGNDTVGAEIVAAVHNGQPCAGTRLSDGRHTVPDAAFAGNVKHPLLLGDAAIEQLGELPQGMGAENDIHIGVAFLDFLGHLGLLRHTAAYADDHIGIFLFIVRGLTHVAKDPHLGVFPDGARVENQHIGLRLVIGEAKAHVDEHTADELAVGLVLLAAKGHHAAHGLTAQTVMVALSDTLGKVQLNVSFFLSQYNLFAAHNASKYR